MGNINPASDCFDILAVLLGNAGLKQSWLGRSCTPPPRLEPRDVDDTKNIRGDA